MVSALVGSQSCWEQRLEWLSKPILAWQSLPQLLQTILTYAAVAANYTAVAVNYT